MIQEGRLVGRIALAQSILGDPATPEEELLRRSPEDLAALAKSLEERLRARPSA